MLCSTPCWPVSSGRTDAERPEHVEQRDAELGRRTGDDALELAEHPLGGHVGEPRSVGARRRAGGGLDVEAQLDREACEAHDPQGVVLDGGGGHEAQPPRLEVGATTERVEELAAVQGLGHGVDGEVAARQVLLDGFAFERHQIDLPGSGALGHAPGAEGLGERERRSALRLGQTAGQRLHVTLGDQVDIVGRAPEEPVAHGSPDDPDRLAGERGARGGQRAVHAGSPSRW